MDKPQRNQEEQFPEEFILIEAREESELHRDESALDYIY